MPGRYGLQGVMEGKGEGRRKAKAVSNSVDEPVPPSVSESTPITNRKRKSGRGGVGG